RGPPRRRTARPRRRAAPPRPGRPGGLPASQVPRAVLQELAGHRGVIDPDDDAMVVCLDWRGRPSA
ncbi:hypothetical protein ABZ054_29940, partial [Streptomyces sp. NPDC006324]